MDKTLIIDFDSTFVTVEVMDELAAVTLENFPEKEKIVSEVREITRLGMEGKIPFNESLARRIKLLQGNKSQVEKLAKEVKEKVSVSIRKNKKFFLENADSIYIISGGFKEVIIPIVSEFGIVPDHVFANTFRFDEKGNIIGVDENNLLSQAGGKVKQIKAANLTGEIYIIGDGFTDYQIKEAGLAQKFIAFSENIRRPNVVALADYEVFSWEEFLNQEKGG